MSRSSRPTGNTQAPTSPRNSIDGRASARVGARGDASERLVKRQHQALGLVAHAAAVYAHPVALRVEAERRRPHDAAVHADAASLDLAHGFRARAHAELRERPRQGQPALEFSRPLSWRPAARRAARRPTHSRRLRVPEGEGHLSLADHLPVDTGDAPQAPHRTPQAQHRGFEEHLVARGDRPPVAHAVDAHEVDEAGVVLRLREDQHGPRLGHRLGQDRRGQHRDPAGSGDEVALVRRHVLDPQHAFVSLQLDDSVDQQERMAVGQDLLDVLDLEGQLQPRRRAHGRRVYF